MLTSDNVKDMARKLGKSSHSHPLLFADKVLNQLERLVFGQSLKPVEGGCYFYSRRVGALVLMKGSLDHTGRVIHRVDSLSQKVVNVLSRLVSL